MATIMVTPLANVRVLAALNDVMKLQSHHTTAKSRSLNSGVVVAQQRRLCRAGPITVLLLLGFQRLHGVACNSTVIPVNRDPT